MVNTKVKMVIVNQTQLLLVLRVGNGNCFATMATVADGGEHTLEIDVHWTYQEFSLEPATAGLVSNKVYLSSDDCCDFERMTVTISEGKLLLEKVARGRHRKHHDVVESRSLTAAAGPEVLNENKRTSFFTWPRTWPQFQWKFWSFGR